MTDEAARAAVRDLIERTRLARGLPEKITDPVVLQRIADILRPPHALRQSAKSPREPRNPGNVP